MIYLVVGIIIGVIGLLISYNGYPYIGCPVFIVGIALGVKGKRQCNKNMGNF